MLELDFRKEGSREIRYSSKHHPARLIDMQPLPSCNNGSNRARATEMRGSKAKSDDHSPRTQIKGC